MTAEPATVNYRRPVSSAAIHPSPAIQQPTPQPIVRRKIVPSSTPLPSTQHQPMEVTTPDLDRCVSEPPKPRQPPRKTEQLPKWNSFVAYTWDIVYEHHQRHLGYSQGALKEETLCGRPTSLLCQHARQETTVVHVQRTTQQTLSPRMVGLPGELHIDRYSTTKETEPRMGAGIRQLSHRPQAKETETSTTSSADVREMTKTTPCRRWYESGSLIGWIHIRSPRRVSTFADPNSPFQGSLACLNYDRVVKTCEIDMFLPSIPAFGLFLHSKFKNLP